MIVAGCAELGVIDDGTSMSVGKPSRGYLVAGKRLPDHGDGFMTREVWRRRGNRYGTDELVDLLTGVARRVSAHLDQIGHGKVVKLVVADLSGRGGSGGDAFHRSHQSGRDADLLYFMRDAKGAPFEPDLMRVFDRTGKARDGSGLTVDIPRTWVLVRELLTAPEANVQWIFMFEPIALAIIDHAIAQREPEGLIARARLAMKQPGDSARHDDHMHVRVYCAPRDHACRDIGPQDLKEGAARFVLPDDLKAALHRPELVRARADRVLFRRGS
ncbi:MAG: penicillin-insensitive murein endopeptidase [Deltaproteobacteria bacterium]|nr:penicillin-insensitive murein endopeptidase [Deltaproteobacteria bacterium]